MRAPVESPLSDVSASLPEIINAGQLKRLVGYDGKTDAAFRRWLSRQYKRQFPRSRSKAGLWSRAAIVAWLTAPATPPQDDAAARREARKARLTRPRSEARPAAKARS